MARTRTRCEEEEAGSRSGGRPAVGGKGISGGWIAWDVFPFEILIAFNWVLCGW